jgi:hypothetical protein
LSVGIILLFIGVALAPSINQSVVKAATDDDLVEVTTELCGLPGITPQTVTLSKHHLNEMETSIHKLKSSYLQSKTLNEKVNVFNQVIDLFSRYGLLGNVNIGYLKMYFNQSIRIQEQIVKSIHNTNKISSKSGDKLFENICCCVYSEAGDEIAFISSPVRTYVSYLIFNKIFSSALQILKYIGIILFMSSFFQRILFITLPFAFNSWTEIRGWGSHVDSNGVYGNKTQSLQGTCVDLLGFFGIKIQYNPVPAGFISFYDGYLIGFAFAISKVRDIDDLFP